ncbi:MAG: hypothetical protein AAFV93_22670 [Chloroflexota bacterium]
MSNEKQMAKDLAEITTMLMLIDADELEQYQKAGERQFNNARDFGSILDPTAYRNAVQNGEMENQKLQIGIIKHLLETRKLIEQLHPSVKIQLIVGNLYDVEGNPLIDDD